MKHALLPILAVLSLAACAGTDPDQGTQPVVNAPQKNQSFQELEAKTPTAPTVAIDERLISRVGALPPQQLDENSCGLFLWANLPKRTLVFHSKSNTTNGVMMLDGSVKNLTRTSGEGQPFAGFFTEQSLTIGDTNVKLQFIPEQEKGFTDGAIIRRASVRMSDGTGWEVVMPVAGLIGCR